MKLFGYTMLSERQLRDFGDHLFMEGFYCAHDAGKAGYDRYGTTRRDNAVAKAIRNLRGPMPNEDLTR